MTYKTVPLEPTDDMLIAGTEAWHAKHYERPAMEDCEEAKACWQAMLAVAPEPVAAQQAEVEALREEVKQRIYRVLRAWQQGGFAPSNSERDDAAREMQEARDAVDRLADLVQRSQPLVHIPKDTRVGGLPCGECHLQAGETCDTCGAKA